MSKIMVVDDEAIVLFDMVMTVEELGYEVLCDSTSVPQALRCLERETPDAALLDIDVGGVMVWPVARRLVELGAAIIFVSANQAHAELRGEFSHCRFVNKPASADEIAHVLQEALASNCSAETLAIRAG